MGWIVVDVNGNEYGFFNNFEDAYELADTIEGSAVYEEEEDQYMGSVIGVLIFVVGLGICGVADWVIEKIQTRK